MNGTCPNSVAVLELKVHGQFFCTESRVTLILYLDLVQGWLIPQMLEHIGLVVYGVPKKSARFNFVIKRTSFQKVLIFLFLYKVHTLRLIVEHNIRNYVPCDSAGTLLLF
jgi:hypothetical protein